MVAGGIIIYFTKIYWIDPLLSIIIYLVFIASTWDLLKINGVIDIHHLHAWAIGTTRNALTAHIVIDEQANLRKAQQIKEQLKHLFAHENIQHVTLETESRTSDCDGEEC
jgi:cobalt-zinc-cadmium efflux system protein